MQPYIPSGGSGFWKRWLRIGATVVAGQVVVADNRNSAPNGEITDPTDVNNYSGAVGVCLAGKPFVASNLTYTTSQGTGDSSAGRKAEVSCCHPGSLFAGNVSGGATAATALNTAGLDGNYLTVTSASSGGIVITESDVGTSEFVKGDMVALNGSNLGQIRTITSHIDNTSETVNQPFDYAIAVDDIFLRCFGMGEQGFELTTNFVEFNGKPGAGVDLPDTGHAVIAFMVYDLTTPTAPKALAVFQFADHFLNPVA